MTNNLDFKMFSHQDNHLKYGVDAQSTGQHSVHWGLEGEAKMADCTAF